MKQKNEQTQNIWCFKKNFKKMEGWNKNKKWEKNLHEKKQKTKQPEKNCGKKNIKKTKTKTCVTTQQKNKKTQHLKKTRGGELERKTT